jgi:ATP-dependent DNA helicase RecG
MMTNPKFMVLDERQTEPQKHFSGGVYPASGKLSSRQIKGIILPVLDHLETLVGEFYDESRLKELGLIGRRDALAWIHMPPDQEKLNQAKRRLKYDELFLMQLGLGLRRYHAQHAAKAPPCGMTDEIDSRIRRRFPFLLTDDQKRLHRGDHRGHGPHDPDEPPAPGATSVPARPWSRCTRRCWPSPTRRRRPSWRPP